MREDELQGVFRAIRAAYRTLGPDAEIIILIKPPDKIDIRGSKANSRLGSGQKSHDAWRKYEDWKKTRQDAVPARSEEQ